MGRGEVGGRGAEGRVLGVVGCWGVEVVARGLAVVEGSIVGRLIPAVGGRLVPVTRRRRSESTKLVSKRRRFRRRALVPHRKSLRRLEVLLSQSVVMLRWNEKPSDHHQTQDFTPDSPISASETLPPFPLHDDASLRIDILLLRPSFPSLPAPSRSTTFSLKPSPLLRPHHTRPAPGISHTSVPPHPPLPPSPPTRLPPPTSRSHPFPSPSPPPWSSRAPNTLREGGTAACGPIEISAVSVGRDPRAEELGDVGMAILRGCWGAVWWSGIGRGSAGLKEGEGEARGEEERRS